LYQYGRCLYKVAVANSDVLGGKVAQEEKKKKNKKAAEVTESAKKEEGSETKEETKDADNKPYFLLEGDAGWTDSEDEGEDAEEAGEGEGEDPEDDFSTAFEILDLARVLFSRQLESLQSADTTSSSSNKGKEKSIDTPEIKHIKERLADTHDLIAEISLENERYEDAATDFKTSIELRSQLLPFEDTILTEAHFKLSLALEFASVTSLREAERQAEAGQKPDDEVKVDMNLREEAAKEMETAISSLKARIEKEQKAYEELNLETLEKEHGSQEKAKEVLAKKKLSLQDAKDMLEDMNLRVSGFSFCPIPTKAWLEVFTELADLVGRSQERPFEAAIHRSKRTGSRTPVGDRWRKPRSTEEEIGRGEKDG